jgi:hypothetical protein
MVIEDIADRTEETQSYLLTGDQKKENKRPSLSSERRRNNVTALTKYVRM